MSCDGDDVLCPREHQACPLGQACGSSYSDDPISLRDSAIRLAEAGHIKAATPLFQAVVALTPSKPQGHSDEGVSWMRLKEYDQARRTPTPPPTAMPRHRLPPPLPPPASVQSWGAFKRALDLDPAHGLSLQNRRDLVGFLSHTPEGQRIMQADDPSPLPRPPRPREHVVTAIPRRAAVATGTAWWRAPFILTESRGRRRRELAANTTPLEAALAHAFAGTRAELEY